MIEEIIGTVMLLVNNLTGSLFYIFSELLKISGDNILNIIISTLFSIFISISISLLYRYTHRGMNYEQSFTTAIVLIAPIISMIVFFIHGSIAISLGMIGALSIIRFRTVIKDTKDMIYLFLSIAVGIGCGTLNWTIVFIATLIMFVTILILHKTEYGQANHSEYIMVITGEGALNNKNINCLIKSYTSSVRIRSQEIDDEAWEYIYELRFEELQNEYIEKLISEIRSIDGVQKVSLLAPQLSLPM